MGDYVNSTQARFDKSFTSCGVLEAHHLPRGNPRKTLYAIANALYHKANPRPVAYVIFSDVAITPAEGEASRGQQLAAFINTTIGSDKIGGFWVTAPQVNPRTGNKIALWVFTPDHEKFRKWYTEETMHRMEE